MEVIPPPYLPGLILVISAAAEGRGGHDIKDPELEEAVYYLWSEL